MPANVPTIFGQTQEAGLRHAWNWFELHAAQRLQSMNFFLISAAFTSAALVGAFGSEQPEIALAVAIIGIGLTIGFVILEARTRVMIHASEAAISRFEAQLAESNSIPELCFVVLVEDSRPKGFRYSIAFLVIYSTIGCGFASAAFYSLSLIF